MADERDEEAWDPKFRGSEELEYFTELAAHETQRWMEAVTRKKFQYPDDPRKSLETGVLLCELLNSLHPGSVKKINRFSTPLAGLDNIPSFLNACRNNFGLSQSQLFDVYDLEDLSQRAIAESVHLKQELDRRLRNVAVTVYWLGRAVAALGIKVPELDLSAFSGLFSADLISNHTAGSKLTYLKTHKPSQCAEDRHAGDSSYGSIGSNDKGSDDNQSIDGELVKSEMYRFESSNYLNRPEKRNSGISDGKCKQKNNMYQSTPNLSENFHKRSSSTDSLDGGHSRQSSGSTENYRTRSSRTNVPSTDPLQFVKTKCSNLAQDAEEQIKKAEVIKHLKKDVLEEELDWVSNFKNWKNKRRNISTSMLSLDNDNTNSLSEELEQPVRLRRGGRTYKEILAEKEKRNSTHFSFNNEADSSSEYSRRKSQYDSSSSFANGDYLKHPVYDVSEQPTLSHQKSDIRISTTEEKTLQHHDKVEKPDSDDEENSIVSESVQNRRERKRFDVSETRGSAEDSGVARKHGETEERNAELYSSRMVSKQSHERAHNDMAVEESDMKEDFVERTVKISQKLRSEKGFGFFITGGSDKDAPVVVQRIALGSAADVCELRVKDEIVSVNKRDITHMAQKEVQDRIDKAIQVGQIELKVKRYLRGSTTTENDSDEEMESSNDDDDDDDEPEKPLPRLDTFPGLQLDNKEKYALQKEAVHTNSKMEEEKKYRRDHLNLEEVKETREEKSVVQKNQIDQSERHLSEDCLKAQARLDSHKEEEESIVKDKPTAALEKPTVTRRSIAPRPHAMRESGTDDVFQSTGQQPPHSEKTAIEESSAIQPPAILRRWQNRPKSQILSSSVDFGSSLPSRSRSHHSMSMDLGLSPPIEAERTLAKRESRSSNTSQEKSANGNDAVLDRVKKDCSDTVAEKKLTVSTKRNYFNLEEEKRQMEEWDQKQQHARQPRNEDSSSGSRINTNEKEVIEKDQQILRNKWDEERADGIRKQEREKEQELLKMEKKHYDHQPPEEEKRQQNGVMQMSVAKFEIAPKSSVSNQGSDFAPIIISPVSRSGPLQIDPNNCQSENYDPATRPIPEYRFRVDFKNSSRHDADFGAKQKSEKEREDNERLKEALLEQERERIRREEKQMLEQKQKKKEEEEQRLLRVKMEQIKLQEEQLERERQQLRREQEEFERQKQEQIRNIRQPVSQNDTEPSKHYHTLKGIPSQQMPSSDVPKITPRVTTKPFKISETPNLVSKKNDLSMTYTSRPPGKAETSESNKLTREDMVAMNRKPTPLQRKPENSQLLSQKPGPITRDPPSKSELHSLNAVPKARRRDSNDWILSNQDKKKHAPEVIATRKLEAFSKFSNPQSHWLVEEAERRRLATENQYGKQSNFSHYYSNAIKPATDNNYWRENRNPGYIQQQTGLFEKPVRSGPHFRPVSSQPMTSRLSSSSDSFGGYGDQRNSPDYSYNSIPSPGFQEYRSSEDFRVNEKYASLPVDLQRQETPASPNLIRNLLSDDGKERVPITGEERCSHCGKELGLGAAMVIESLHLFYHVDCFRCYVCRVPLGNGAQGADVRVRVSKLHCCNCYSNDEAGLKYSKV